ncbi:hypothetical protein A3L12_06820 [Thermococcus sp. P6]|uniref:transglutaminase-like domain-containing protein n=1 Tax=Thermococcus sp. P6 TaxID=122420 RepID=UPI000B5FB172|nr:transglutaminase-like domain-containing protein [Thermococcus sp. P6]ASJ11342.1 hypothetical protein A3L12_06820 [Thermococcus sp. P6]
MMKFSLTIALALMVITAGCISFPPGSSTTMPKAPGPANEGFSLPDRNGTFNCSGILWRYVLREALGCMLNEEELNALSPLAERLRGENLTRSVWNVLRWEGEELSYDYEKAREPSVRIVTHPDGHQEVIEGRNNTIQTPYETIKRKKGVCADYTVLTVALLLAMNHSPVYAMEMNLTGEGHAAALVRIGGWYFFLDQHLPPMDPASYYRHWKREGRDVLNATLYEVTIRGNKADVRVLGTVSKGWFLGQDYTVTDADVRGLALSMMSLLRDRYNLKADGSLREAGGGFPEGYGKIRRWEVTYYALADAYHPLFRDGYSEWLVSRMLSNGELEEEIEKSDAVWIDARKEGEDLILTIYLGSS